MTDGSADDFSRTESRGYNRSYVVLLAATGLGLLVLISIFSFWSGRKYRESANWADHTTVVLESAHVLQVLTERIETSERGFLLTRQERFLETFFDSKKSMFDELRRLGSLVRDNSAQTAKARELDGLLSRRVEFLETTIRKIQAGRTKEAMIEFGTGSNSRDVSVLREHFAEFIAVEKKLLARRKAVADDDFARASWQTVAGIVFAFFLLLMVTLILRKEISRRARVQRALIVAEQKAVAGSNLKTQFLANMSHELRTPLNGIIGMTKLLSETKLDVDQREAVSTVRESSSFLLSLINQILDLSKIESGKLQLEEVHFELRSLVEGTRAMVAGLAEEKKLALAVQVDADVPDHYLGDPLRLRQILLNLLNNAIKFSSSGTIRLKVSRLTEFDSSHRIAFSVSDEGVGFDDETRVKLFKTFSQGDDSTTRRFGGTGLGLAIARQLVEMMDGRIDVESRTGLGSRFFFDVVLKSAKYEAALSSFKSNANVSIEAGKIDAHVLVVEDNLTNQKVAGAILKRLGCTFKIVDNGAEALAALRVEDFRLVLMDGQMPVMDGYQATREIRQGAALEKNRNIPIIAVTANAIKGDLETCLLAGMNDYVAKPISIDDIRWKIQKWLRAGSGLIDFGVLKELGELEIEGKDSIVGELIETFATEMVVAIRKMRQALSDGSLEQLKREAHSFKSTCANIGAIRSRELVLTIEKTNGLDERKQTQELIDTLERECQASIKELRKYGAA